MPWEKSFDEELALEKAMQVFWCKGFESASITDLLASTGLNRGSFYNAFGGKQELFVKVLQKYDREHRQAILSSLEAMDQPKAAIGALLDAIVAETVADQNHKGCFVFNTALEIAAHDAQVQEIVINGVRETEAFFRRCIEVAQARKEIPETVNAQNTAKTLLALIVAIRVLGRGVFAAAALHTIAEQGKQLIAAHETVSA